MSLRGIASAIAFPGLLIWISQKDQGEGSNAAILLFALSGLLNFLSTKGWFDAKLEMNIYSRFLLIEKVLYALLLVLALSNNLELRDSFAIAMCLLSARVLVLGAQWRRVSATLQPTLTNLWPNILWVARGNVLIFSAALANLAAPYLNQLILGQLLGFAALASYFAAFQLMAAVQLLQQIGTRLISPRIAALTDRESLTRALGGEFRNLVGATTLIITAIVLPIMLLSPYLFEWILPASYADSLPIFQILCLSIVFHGIALNTSQFLIGLRLNTLYLQFCIARGLIAIALGFVLVSTYGVIGVAITLLLVRTVSACLLYLYTRRYIEKLPA